MSWDLSAAFCMEGVPGPGMAHGGLADECHACHAAKLLSWSLLGEKSKCQTIVYIMFLCL